MNNTVGNILNFFSDTNKSLSSRVGTVIISVTLLFCIDSITGLTYNFQLNNKLNQLEKLSKLKDIYSANDKKIKRIESIEFKILSKQHYSELVSSWFSSKTHRTIENDKKPNKAKATNSMLNKNWMVFSSSYSLVILLPFLILTLFMPSNWKDVNFIIGWFAGSIIIVGIIALITLIAYQIPIINKEKPFINYIINALIHTVFLVPFVNFINKNQ